MLCLSLASRLGHLHLGPMDTSTSAIAHTQVTLARKPHIPVAPRPTLPNDSLCNESLVRRQRWGIPGRPAAAAGSPQAGLKLRHQRIVQGTNRAALPPADPGARRALLTSQITPLLAAGGGLGATAKLLSGTGGGTTTCSRPVPAG